MRHTEYFFLLALVTLVSAAAAQREISLDRDNIVVTRSVRIKPGRYRVADREENGVLRIQADDVVVDFQGAELAAMDLEGADLGKARGVGISVEGARNVTIRNARVHGYFINIRARGAAGLRLENCNADFSRAHRIARGGQHKNIWLHLRSLEAWQSYGAGFWIEKCDHSVLRGCRACRAQNGLLVVDSSSCTVTGCDFSFNSGWGLGLWGASRNVVAWNRIDFVNRPWGGGWGGDSAGLVVVNGSCENFIAGNSLTHGGDGFFLTDRVNGGINGTEKTTNIQGSCDRNVIARNDGSWSPCNAFEGTFSRGNVYFENTASDSRYGFWLGYSDDSLLLGNEVLGCKVDGIAIEHGSGTRVEGNTFRGMGRAAVALWSSDNWLNDLHPSRDIEIRDNRIQDCRRAFHLKFSTGVSAGGNEITNAPGADFDFVPRPPARALEKFKASKDHARLQEILAARPKDFAFYRDQKGPRGIDWIRTDDFSPRDFRGGIVAWRKKDSCTLEVFPLESADLEFKKPGWITVEKDAGGGTWIMTARPARGPGDVKGYTVEVRQRGRTQVLTGSFITAQWDVRWYRWDRPEKLAYGDRAAWKRLFRSRPIHSQTARGVSKALWARGFPEGVPQGHFALVARTRIRLPGGRYCLSTLSDDGLRVFLDGKEVISRWNHHGPTPDRTEVKIRRGVHEFIIHYCQQTGASALEFGWTKVDG